MPDALSEYTARQQELSHAAGAAALSVLAQWVTGRPDPKVTVFAELATNTTLLHATGAALSSAGWVADWVSVSVGTAVPIPDVSVVRNVERVRDSFTTIGRTVDTESRQYFAIRDRLMKAEGLDSATAGHRAMDAIRAQAEKRAQRLAANVCRDAGADGMSEAMALTGRIEGWTRQTNGDTCPVCTSLANGAVLPPGARMVRHPGCDCTQRPILKGQTA